MNLGFLPQRGPTLAFAVRESACQPVLPRSLARIVIKTPRYAGNTFCTQYHKATPRAVHSTGQLQLAGRSVAA